VMGLYPRSSFSLSPFCRYYFLWRAVWRGDLYWEMNEYRAPAEFFPAEKVFGFLEIYYSAGPLT